MKTFYKILFNTLFVSVTNFFVWFALVFWLYLETRSVIGNAVVGGSFMVAMSISGFWLGSIVDHHRKKWSMMVSSIATLVCFILALLVYIWAPEGVFQTLMSPMVWLLVALILVGVIASNIRGIALPTLVTMLVPEDRRDKANGMTGMIMGASSVGAGLTSGFVLAYAGMFWVLLVGVILTIASIIHLAFISIPEKEIVHTAEKPKKVDMSGTIKLIKAVPGLFALIFFTTFNNFLGGVFMALMDPYGLSLMSVQAWSVMWGVLSMGFIVGGAYIAKNGLGKNPLKKLFTVNIIIWSVCILFTIQPSIWLLGIGIFMWVCLSPFIEATEHTIVQKVVPLERQGRVFGFAQSIESGAMPIMAFIIGPIAQFIFIPYMTNGRGVELIGDWFGTGPNRGMALVFIVSGIAGLIVTLIAMHSKAYKLLGERYREEKSG